MEGGKWAGVLWAKEFKGDEHFGATLCSRPWVLLGDFNAAINLEDHSCGSYTPDIAMREFKDCVNSMEVADDNSTGLHFTWNQKPKDSNGTLKKIDRTMGNLQFCDIFPGSFAIFQPYRISDHSPCVLRIHQVAKLKPKPFKFSNFLVHKEGFLDTVTSGWNLNVNGCALYRVVKRLKGLKSPFRKLLHNQGNLHERVDRIRKDLDEVQKAIDRDPFNSALPDEHAHCLLAFKEATLDEERFLKQKSKFQWLHAGDSNTAYFYNIVKSKCARNRIELVRDSANVLYEGNAVVGAFVSHYEHWGWRKLLAIRPMVRPFIWHKINNGKTTSVWFDMWCDLSPIRYMLTARDIVRAGLSLSDSVCDVIDNGTWRWSTDWFSRFPNLVNLPVPNLIDDSDDGLIWRDLDGNFRLFSVACA
ncbi:RNA-directed DNA polymerase, eukaryota, Reverse transcriptase zinc-binding domain protein [Artemisia annua]|uniref:RNA-directed DNA polymerase, eukaryota, Reverse transcriptase zinc-binding domain protein n=1 Tax=Artemisia annua TaxID=35608 RepID=A0A2U1NQA4_ARTAN|nr:RNA-directed DNA polymerase, eukaryota, Reverse transcriptase zinc-binding domain protein [Artemisia annua]